MVMEIVLCIIIENKLLMMMMKNKKKSFWAITNWDTFSFDTFFAFSVFLIYAVYVKTTVLFFFNFLR